MPLPEHLQGLAAGVLGRLSGQEQRQSGGFIPQHLSNMLWGCAKLRYAHRELLTRLAGAAGKAAGRLKEQELSNNLWALGRLVEAGCLDGSSGVPGVQRLAEEVEMRVRERRAALCPQDLSSVLLGLAHLHCAAQPGVYKVDAVVEALAHECHMGRGFQSFNYQHLSNAAWALAKLGYGRQAWYAGCVEAALQPGSYTDAVGQDWSNLWWALAAARHRPSDAQLLLSCTADAMAAQRDETVAQHCTNPLWALATLGLYDRRLVGCLLGRLVELLPSGSVMAQNLANALWAVAVMGPDALHTHVGQVQALLQEVSRSWREADGRTPFMPEHFRQLFQTQLELEVHPAPEVRAMAAILPGATGSSRGSLGSAMRVEVRPYTDSDAGRVAREVAAALRRMQLGRGGGAGKACGADSTAQSITEVAERVVVKELARWVDVEALLGGSRAVAVVVDSHLQYLANQPGVRIGGVQLRNRQLQRVYGEGNAVGVSVREWDALGRDAWQQEALLRALLRRGGGMGDGNPQHQQQQQQPRKGARMGVAAAASVPPATLQAPVDGSPPPPQPLAVSSADGSTDSVKPRQPRRPRRVRAPQGNGDGRAKRG